LRLTPNLNNSGRGIHYDSLLRSKKASSNTDFDGRAKHTKKKASIQTTLIILWTSSPNFGL